MVAVRCGCGTTVDVIDTPKGLRLQYVVNSQVRYCAELATALKEASVIADEFECKRMMRLVTEAVRRWQKKSRAAATGRACYSPIGTATQRVADPRERWNT